MSMALMAIEADRQAIIELPIDVRMLASLRDTARLLSTHYSTQIEGNRLTRSQVQDALGGKSFPGRERDETEVRHYYAALERVEKLASDSGPLAEADVQCLHGLVLNGRARATAYRDGQNVIRDSRTNKIVYLPPEAGDVPRLMKALVAWIGARITKGDLPVPLVAGLAHYEFATIHPYYDGNGRTARLLTTLILQRHGYGLNGIYSLEEYYARRLGDYYRALDVGPSHNYYEGRAEADVTPFIAHFLAGMADSFSKVRAKAAQAADRGATDRAPLLRRLDPKQRRLLELFSRQAIVTAAEIAEQLAFSPRTVRPLCTKWIEDGFLVVHDPSRRNRLYALAPKWEAAVGR